MTVLLDPVETYDERKQMAVGAEMTPDEFERHPHNGGFELVDGIVQENAMGAESTTLAGRMFFLFAMYVEEHRIAIVCPNDTAFRCFGSSGENIRKPDAAVVLLDRLPGGVVPVEDWRIPPDIAVEVVSPNDDAEELEKKIVEYFAAGVKIVWTFHPALRGCRVHAANGSSQMYYGAAVLDASAVLPGFKIKVQDVYAVLPEPPSPPAGDADAG